MARQNVFKYPKTDEFGDKGDESPVVVGWFDTSKAEKFDELRYCVGGDFVSVHTGDRYAHQELYRTAGGRWVTHSWDQRVNALPKFEFVTDKAAQAWLVLNEDDDVVERHFGKLEPERGPGRPEELADPVAMSLRLERRMVAQLDERAKADGVSRAELIRRFCGAGLAS